MARAQASSSMPGTLSKNGVRKPGLMRENSATNTKGITVTMRADSFAWAVCTRNERSSSISPSTDSRAASNTWAKLPPLACCTSRATATKASSEALPPRRNTARASDAVPPVSSRRAEDRNTSPNGPFISDPVCRSVCISESPARKHTPRERSASGISSRRAQARRSASPLAKPPAATNAHPATAKPNTGEPAASHPTPASSTEANSTTVSSAVVDTARPRSPSASLPHTA